MDKNTVTGISLIAIILLASFYFFGPKKSDKPVIVNHVDTSRTMASKPRTAADSLKKTSAADTSKVKAKSNVPSGWESITQGQNKDYTLENAKLRIRIASKGGMIDYAELKNYKTATQKPLILLDSSSHSGYQLSA